MTNTNEYIETHIGEFLEEEFLNTYGLSQNALAMAIHVPATRINNIVKGKIGITVDTDLRLCKFFSLKEGYFISIQNRIERTMAKKNLVQELNSIIPFTENSSYKQNHIT